MFSLYADLGLGGIDTSNCGYNMIHIKESKQVVLDGDGDEQSTDRRTYES